MVSSTTSAPELTQEQVQHLLVKPLEAASVFLSSGVRIFDVTAAGPVRIPKLVSMDAPNWHGENELITEVNADFGEVVLLDGVKSLKSITRYSNELARSSVVALDAALQDKMVIDVASKLDRALMAGTRDPDVVTGRNTTPLGLLKYSGTSALLGIGTLSIDDLHDAIGIALGNNADPSRMRWILRSEVFVNLRKQKDASGKYLIEPDVSQAGGYRLLGLAVTVSNRLPFNLGTGSNETAVVLWDPATVAVARDLAPPSRSSASATRTSISRRSAWWPGSMPRRCSRSPS